MQDYHDTQALYENGKRIMTDGGAVAGMGGGAGDAPTPNAQVDRPGDIEGDGGSGFDQLAANSIASKAAMEFGTESDVYKQAAANAAAIRPTVNYQESFATNDALRKDEWKNYDQKLLQVAKPALKSIDILRGYNLVTNTDLGTLVHMWETETDWEDAEIDMHASTSSTADDVEFNEYGVPLPIAHKSWRINKRKLMASRRRGASLRTGNVARAGRSVSAKLNDQLLYGSPVSFNGKSVEGLLSTTHAGSISLSGAAWTDTANTTIENIRTDVLSGIEFLENNEHEAAGLPYEFWLSREAYQEPRRRTTGTDQERSLWKRLNEEFGDLVNFRMFPRLNTGDAVMFKPVEDVVELVNASDMQNVAWNSNDGMTLHMKTMASITPVIKEDEAGNQGIAQYSGLA